MKKLWTSASVRMLARKRMEKADAAAAPATAAPASREAPAEAPPRAASSPAKPNDNLSWMWGRFEKSYGNRVVLCVPAEDADAGEEMQLLCETLGLEVVDLHYFTIRNKPTPSTYVGEGVIEQLTMRVEAMQAAAVVMNAPLSPGQVRNIEEELKCAVLDRQGVILAIFELHAKTKLAKMQVELARLKYLLPRLAGMWTGLSRQSGAKGGLGGRGLGETRLELDRRVVKDRISALSKKVKESEKAYLVQSARRTNLPRVALVGYTNAGKSTLMCQLTKTQVEVEDKLFSTLDTTVRPLLPPTDPKILVSDTVGFVRDLPHDLVASFRSTLREALDSQLILHVVDSAHPRWRDHIQTTDEVLEEIGAGDIDKILILNKSDMLGGSARFKQSDATRLLSTKKGYVKKILVSAKTGEGLAELRQALLEYLEAKEPRWSRDGSNDESEVES